MKGMKPIESGDADDRLMHVTFHNGSEATMRCRRNTQGDHPPGLVADAKAGGRKIGTATGAIDSPDEIARKRARMQEESRAEGSTTPATGQIRSKLRPKRAVAAE